MKGEKGKKGFDGIKTNGQAGKAKRGVSSKNATPR